jgi:hypothetical protein
MPSGDVYLEFLRKNRVNTPTTAMVRRSVFDEIGIFTVADCEDYDLWLRIARNHAVAYCPETLTFYRVRPSSLSRNYERFLKAHLAILDDHLSSSETLNKYPKDEVLSAVEGNKQELYKKYAYQFYYERTNLDQARHCLLESMKIRVTDARDVIYLILFNFPLPVVNFLRNLKRCFGSR